MSPHVYAVGTCAEEILLGLIKVKDINKKLFILTPFDIPFLFKYKLTNSALFSLESTYIYKKNMFVNLVMRFIITFVYLPLRLVSLAKKKVFKIGLSENYNFPRIGISDLVVPEGMGLNFSFDIVKEIGWKGKLNYDFQLFVKKEYNYMSLLDSMGIPKGSKFVCLHVRESGFRNDMGRREYRNSSIKNYIPAIREITSKGIYVVRMGDNTMTPLPSMDKVIDYPFTKYKSDQIDLILIKYCYFFIGCQSGVYDVARLFHKNILVINMYNWTFGGPLRKKDRGILKHIFSKKDKKYLSVEEMYTGEWEIQNLFGDVENYIFVENSESEIVDAIVNYMCLMQSDTHDISKLQIKSEKYKKRQAYDIFKNNTLVSDNPIIETFTKYRLATHVEGASGLISDFYLNTNWSTDSLQNDINHEL
jgi:putative glycosyltransferase (TIGR04372 family)